VSDEGRPRRGRFISFDDDDDLVGPADPAIATAVVARSSVAALLGLVVVAATSAWTAVAFSGRGPDDITVTAGRSFTDAAGKAVTLPDRAKYTGSFLVKAEGPFFLAVLLCAAGFIWWHAYVDRATRDSGEMLESPRWKVVGGWFFPGGNLAFPIRSLRELTEVHNARVATLVAIPWWVVCCLATFVNAFLLRAGAQSSSGPRKGESGVLELDRLDKYGVFVGCANLVGALLAVVLVWNLTAAVRSRITEG
jgi:hypothetical protein